MSLVTMKGDPISEIWAAIRSLEFRAPAGSTAVSRGQQRFVGNESILVQGSGKVEGWWVVTGTQNVVGLLQGSGTLDWTGPASLRGNTNIMGLLGVSGAVTFHNSLDVLTRLTLGPSGYLEAGTVRIDRAGPYGGRIVSSGTVLVLDAGVTTIIDSDQFIARDSYLSSLDVLGAVSASVKSFKIPHPTKADHYLRHGCTESPVSGIEYTGTVALDAAGEAVVELPEYFEALAKPAGRTVHVTPVGRPFLAGADLPADGRFTVYGDPGRTVSWLVKAERVGAEFVLEEPVFGPLREEAAA